MQPRIIGHLGVKAEADVWALSDRDGIIAKAGDNLGSGSGPDDEWGADEHGVERIGSQRGNHEVGFEQLDLPPVSVAPDGDVEHTEIDLVGPPVEHLTAEQDETGAGGQRRHPLRKPLAKRRFQSEDLDQPAHRRRLAARQHERVDALEVCRGTDRCCLRATAAECREMFTDVALEGENAYPQDCRSLFSGRERSVPGGAGFASFAHL